VFVDMSYKETMRGEYQFRMIVKVELKKMGKKKKKKKRGQPGNES